MKDKLETSIKPSSCIVFLCYFTFHLLSFDFFTVLFICFLFYFPYNILFVIIIINILYTTWHYNLLMYLISLIKIYCIYYYIYMYSSILHFKKKKLVFSCCLLHILIYEVLYITILDFIHTHKFL